jgi:hypothetical protein
MNYYEALEVSPKASPEVLRAAYKSLIQRYHPDRHPGDQEAAVRSRLVVEAYQVLSDADKRAAYDHQLLRQQASREAASRPRAVPPAPARRASRDSHWLLWPITAVVVLALWFFWSAFDERPAAGAKGSNPASNSAPGAAAGPAPTGLRGVAPEASARTLPNFLENLQVSLVVQAKPANPAAAPGATPGRYLLSIRTVGVVIGDFDPDKFVALLEGNKDYIGRQLQQRLAQANYALLSRDTGERYLKQYLLDTLGEITNTDRLEKSALPGSAAHYGAVEILLPDSFSLEPEGQPAVLR